MMISDFYTIEICWSLSHDCHDDDVERQLEAGRDEGPLLVLSAEQSSRCGAARVIGVFRNIGWYQASLVADDDAAHRERWVGLVRGVERDNGDKAVAALQCVARTVSPGRSTRNRGRARSLNGVGKAPYGAVTETIELEVSATVVNCGDGFREVARAYPAILPTISIQI